jgi:hypothetical protein
MSSDPGMGEHLPARIGGLASWAMERRWRWLAPMIGYVEGYKMAFAAFRANIARR